MSENKVGTVIWFNSKKGFGFISQGDKQPDMFIHFSDIVCEGYRTLKKGQTVSYEIGKNNSGRDKAINVTVVELAS
jgi:CspA family cold shock protein